MNSSDENDISISDIETELNNNWINVLPPSDTIQSEDIVYNFFNHFWTDSSRRRFSRYTYLPGCPYFYIGFKGNVDVSVQLYSNNATINLPIMFISQTVLVPTQIIAIHIFIPSLVSVIKKLIQTTRIFGIVCRPGDCYGVTAEIVDIKYEADSRSMETIFIKCIVRQRFTTKHRISEESNFSIVTIRDESDIGVDIQTFNPLCRCRHDIRLAKILRSTKIEGGEVLLRNMSHIDAPVTCNRCTFRTSYYAQSLLMCHMNPFFLCAKTIIALEKLCAKEDAIANNVTLKVGNLENIDELTLYIMSLGVDHKVKLPFKTFAARMAMHIVKTSGLLMFAYWFIRNIPITDQDTRLKLLHRESSNYSRLNSIMNLIENVSDPYVRCKACHSSISSLADLLTVHKVSRPSNEPYMSNKFKINHYNFSPELHVFPGDMSTIQVNPQGVLFEVVTFSETCRSPLIRFLATTRSNSWFPGYSWQTFYCQNCGHHLGWIYMLISRDKYFTKSEEAEEEDFKNVDNFDVFMKRPERFYGLIRSEIVMR